MNKITLIVVRILTLMSIIIVCIAAITTMTATADANYDSGSHYYTATLDTGESTEEFTRVVSKIRGIHHVRKLKQLNIVNFKTRLSVVRGIVAKHHQFAGQIGELKKFNYSNQVKRVPKVKSSRSVNADYSDLHWGIKQVTENGAVFARATGKNVDVAMIDSGVDQFNSSLSKYVISKRENNFVQEHSNIDDENGHGTGTASILKRMAPNAKITSYKVIDQKDGESEWVIEAIVKAVDDGNKIINLSAGTYKDKRNISDNHTILAYSRAIDYAKEKGVIIVASAGNDALNLDSLGSKEHVPGGMQDLVTVGAVRKDGSLASYSNYGNRIDVVAPGGDVYASNGQVDLTQMILVDFPQKLLNPWVKIGLIQTKALTAGTSVAAPFVSGALALLEEKKNNSIGISEVQDYLKNGSVDLGIPGRDMIFGVGRINASKLLNVKEKI